MFKILIIIINLLLFFQCGKIVKIDIQTQCKWTGIITTDNKTTTFDGIGNKIIDVGNVNYIAATVQKDETNYNNLTVSIKSEWDSLFMPDGVDSSSSTESPYGIVSIYYDYK